MKITLTFFLICSAVIGFAQDKKYHFLKTNFNESHYQFSNDIIHELDADTFLSDGKNYQTAAWELSFINDYKDVLTVWDRGGAAYANLSAEDSLRFLQFKPVPAKDYILNRAKSEQIIMINEAHHQPNHRIFTESLLPGLYRLGYRYFGAETLSQFDSSLNERKYPTYSSGYYTRQPQYGNLVRTALQEGFTVFAYEAEPGKNGKEREIEQAQNIKAVLDSDPNAKIIIHCGFDHIIESDVKDWEKAMAGRVKEFTHIDPFTIDQVKLTEVNNEKLENPFYKMVNANTYSVFVDSAGNLFNGPMGVNQYDARVYHPRSRSINGRPHWYFENERQPVFINDSVTVSFPCLVFAYFSDEDTLNAVPTDIIELKTREDKVALALRKGEYIVNIRDRNGNKQQFRIKL